MGRSRRHQSSGAVSRSRERTARTQRLQWRVVFRLFSYSLLTSVIEEQGVAVILNVKTCLQLGVTFWIHPNGSIRTNGDASGHIDPQLFESAHLIEWERETLMSDGEPSLLLAKPTSKPSFRDRDSTPRPGRMAERSPFVEKLSAKLSEAKHVQAESPNIGASQDRIFGRLQSTQVSAPPHLANGDQPPSFVPKITAKG